LDRNYLRKYLLIERAYLLVAVILFWLALHMC
jgi:hypothetical protein